LPNIVYIYVTKGITMKFTLSLFLLFFVIPVYSQTEQKIDSLNNVISNTSKTETKLEAYKEILFLESSSNLDNMLINIEKIKALYRDESCAYCLGVAIYWEGLYHYFKGNLAEAIPYFESATKVARKAGDTYTSNRALTLLSGIYFGLNDYLKSDTYATQLISYGEAQKEVTDALIDGYFMKGLINDDQSYYSLAIANYNKADSLNTVKNGPNFYNYQAKLYNNLSIVFIQIKDFEKAASYLEKTELNYKKYDNKEGLYSVKQNFGYLEVERENYQKAVEILSETNSFYKELEMKHKEGESNYLMGRAFYGLNKYKLAIQHLDQSLVAFKNAGDTLNAGLSHKYLGDSYLKLDDYENSESNFKQALAIFNSLNAHRNQLNTLKSYSSLFEKTKNHSQALKFFKKFDSINTIFQIKQNEKSVFELDTKYQTEKKQQEITLLTSQNELVQQQKTNQRNLLLAGLGITTLAGLFFFFQYRNRQKTNTKLQELDTAKSTFFANISHEFRTPLALIKGPLEDQLEEPTLKRNQRKNLLTAQKNTERLEGLVEQLLALSKLESGAMKLQVQPTQLDSFLTAQVESFQYVASEKNNSYTVDLQNTNEPSWIDQDIIEKICVNLLGNAFKYSPDGANIHVTSNNSDGVLELSVHNTGIWLSAKEQHDIFIRFYQTRTNNPGSGIGLALTKELVCLHKGTITVTSSKEKGVTFKISIPISEEKYAAEEKLNEQLYTTVSNFTEEATTTLITTETTSPEDAPLLLLVDDSKEIRDYVASIFESTYTILTATNGKEGFETAQKHIPDIIISDVMMPVADGFELTKNCKEDTLTSHIPILLLTAKNEITDQLEGLGIGADAYLTKPFSSKLLKARIKNLLENRRKLQERFSQDVILTPKEIAVTSADELFLERLQKVLDEELTNSEFSATVFCEAMGVSRMQLHRKLKALTGYSTTEFIRSQRLKLAKQLIEQNKISISEVGYTVGFNDPSYFSKCFKQEFGQSPTDFLKKT
jgi:signal transduction histidine kinase/DNA-binding response OmpR family regulator